MPAVAVVLWHIEVSHFNEKVRWALDFKGIPHRRRAPLPGLTQPIALALTRGRQRRTPVLQLDGRTIGDSTAIIAALEAYRPDRPLYPQDPAERARALALEEHFDEALGPEVRRFAWWHTLQEPSMAARALQPTAGATRRRALQAVVPVIAPVVRGDFAISEQSAARARERIVAAMDRLETELDGREHLVGETFTVADLTAATLFTPVLAPPQRQGLPETVVPAVAELRAELEARPGGAWVAATFARHRGTSAELA